MDSPTRGDAGSRERTIEPTERTLYGGLDMVGHRESAEKALLTGLHSMARGWGDAATLFSDIAHGDDIVESLEEPSMNETRIGRLHQQRSFGKGTSSPAKAGVP